MEQYETPATTQHFEIEIKRSRFITTFAHVEHKAAAKTFINTLRTQWPDANHHCWATIAGAPDDVRQHDQSDDGEPKGTAGKPMLNVLQHSGLGNVVVIATRYFGGIKLGAGGLVRAYTQSVSSYLTELQTTTVYKKTRITLQLPYSSLETLDYWLSSTNITVGEKQFAESVILPLDVPPSELEALKSKILEIGSGTIRIL